MVCRWRSIYCQNLYQRVSKVPTVYFSIVLNEHNFNRPKMNVAINKKTNRTDKNSILSNGVVWLHLAAQLCVCARSCKVILVPDTFDTTGQRATPAFPFFSPPFKKTPNQTNPEVTFRVRCFEDNIKTALQLSRRKSVNSFRPSEAGALSSLRGSF